LPAPVHRPRIEVADPFMENSRFIQSRLVVPMRHSSCLAQTNATKSESEKEIPISMKSKQCKLRTVRGRVFQVWLAERENHWPGERLQLRGKLPLLSGLHVQDQPDAPAAEPDPSTLTPPGESAFQLFGYR